jgi:hypothetical protein
VTVGLRELINDELHKCCPHQIFLDEQIKEGEMVGTDGRRREVYIKYIGRKYERRRTPVIPTNR